ncbi:MAG: hypothetical protein AB8G05_08690 [Oligoflexales bacterium]
MKHHLLFLMNCIPLLWMESKACLAASDKLLATIELSLQTYQQQRLDMDMPAASIALDHQRGLWIAGKRSLWKWNFKGKKLLEINLIKNEAPAPDETLRYIATWNKGLMVASHKKLYKISFHPLKVFEFQASEKLGIEHRSHGFQIENSRFFWIRSNGVWSMNQKESVLAKWRSHPRLRKTDRVLFDLKKEKLWAIRKNKLLTYSYTKKGKRPQLLLEIKYPFIGIRQTESEIAVHTRHTILVLNENGTIQKTIPVEGKRKLVLADFHDGQHSYLFHDRFLEIHRTDNIETLYSRVKLGRVRKAGQMIARKNMLGLILDGKPRVFQIEGRW